MIKQQSRTPWRSSTRAALCSCATYRTFVCLPSLHRLVGCPADCRHTQAAGCVASINFSSYTLHGYLCARSTLRASRPVCRFLVFAPVQGETQHSPCPVDHPTGAKLVFESVACEGPTKAHACALLVRALLVRGQALIIPCQPAGINPRPTRSGTHGTHSQLIRGGTDPRRATRRESSVIVPPAVFTPAPHAAWTRLCMDLSIRRSCHGTRGLPPKMQN